jgi:beta-glucosidase
VLLKNAHHILPLSPQQRIYVAGSNADNLGAQTGGWTLSWQGQPGPIPIPGTTILQGIQAKDPNVTYSATASSPTSGYDVGVVVVGEHPYAEGQGDVGFNAYPSQNGNIANLNLTPADHQAVDTVCHAMPCVVMIVSGRPMTITDQLPEIDGLVASWLPGTEGEGVADTLFGTVPFTGQLPQAWPRSLDQLPMNPGAGNDNPLFPFGWGLQTSTPRQDMLAALDALNSGSGAGRAHARLAKLTYSRRNWTGVGAPRQPNNVLRTVTRMAAALQGSSASFAQQKAVVTIARDIAQNAAVAAGGPDARASSLIAAADHALLTGHPDTAVQLLKEAAS